jgi:hypothetical protein
LPAVFELAKTGTAVAATDVAVFARLVGVEYAVAAGLEQGEEVTAGLRYAAGSSDPAGANDPAAPRARFTSATRASLMTGECVFARGILDVLSGE